MKRINLQWIFHSWIPKKSDTLVTLTQYLMVLCSVLRKFKVNQVFVHLPTLAQELWVNSPTKHLYSQAAKHCSQQMSMEFPVPKWTLWTLFPEFKSCTRIFPLMRKKINTSILAINAKFRLGASWFLQHSWNNGTCLGFLGYWGSYNRWNANSLYQISK